MIIHRDQDFERIAKLPRRFWSKEDLEKLSAVLTARYKTPNGTQSLFPVQAQILAEAYRMRGCYTSAPVGAGKTLPCLLLPTVLKAKRPCLFVPASLRHKTYKDIKDYRQHWQIPKLPVFSYELLQHANHRNLLDTYSPDLIIADECDRLKINTTPIGPRAKRILEYFQKNPSTMFIGLTGTPVRTSFLDFWHHLLFALKENAPVPLFEHRADEWAQALDPEPKRTRTSWDSEFMRREPDNLFALGDGTEQGTPVEKAGECVQKRLTQSWGFVNLQGMSCDQPIYLRRITHRHCEAPLEVIEAIEVVEESSETLADDILETPLEVAAYKRQLATGFFHLWDPAPPDCWMQARRKWKSYVRDYLTRGYGDADSPALVAQENPDHPLFKEWLAVKDTFDEFKNRKVAWISDYLIEDVADRVKEPTLVWVGFVEFAKTLAKRTGWKYYGAGKQDGVALQREKGDRPVIVSIDAHHYGKNLQAFHRNLVVTPPSAAQVWEQLIGRTHRTRQKKSVWVDIYTHTPDSVQDFDRAMSRARFEERLTAQPQKLIWSEKV
jgi:hypothetical protein